MEGPTFRKSYTNKSQYIYDEAVTSDYFDLASYNAAKNDENTEVADLYAAFATTAKNKQSPTFNMDDYELLSGDYNTQMLYLENELLTDRNEMSADNTYNIYDKNKEYLDSIIDQKRREKWYNELNDWDKFWTNVGNVAGDVLNTVYGIVDKVSDALVLLYGASADMLTAGQFHQQISEGTKYAIDLDWTGTEKIASELDKLRSVTAVGKDGFLKAVDEVVTGIANMAPILIPGLGQLGQLAYGASMLGGAASEAINKNPDIDLFDLSIYSAAVAGVEYGTEFISGKIFGGADLIGSKMMGTPVRQAKGWLSRIGMDFVSEAFEEGVSEIVDSLLDVALVRGVDSKIASMQDILHAALIGGVTGAIITGAGIAFTSNDAINTKTNEIVNYSKAIAEGVNPDVLKKLSKIDTINMREALSQATQAMRVNHVDEFYVNKNRNEGLSEEQARQKYSKEYEKAVKLDEENAKQIADAATILTKAMEWAGADGFVKAADILDFAKEEQARLIRNFTEKQPTDNLKYKLLEKAINDKFPNTSFSVTEELTAAQLNLQDSMKKEYGIDVVYGKYGNPEGISKNTSFALNENTIVLDSELYKSTSTREAAEKYAKQSLVQAFQLKSGVLSPDNIKIINDVLNSTKFTNYNASIVENIKELQSKDVNKLSNAELQKYAKLQQETMAQLLLFDDATIGKVFMGSPKTFKQTWKWLTQQGNFFKNLIKTPINKLQFNYVMKSLRRYENAIVNNSPNLQYLKDAAKDLGADEETVVRMERQYNPNNKPKNFEHWAYMPIAKNTNYEDYMHVSYVMSDLTNNNFTFENAFNPEIYQDETLRSLWLADNTHGKTFKYNLQNYLINNHGFVIDDVHKQFVRVTEFAQHTALNWATDLMGLEDGTITLTDLQYDYRTVGDVFSEEFNDNVYNKESGENLYNYRLKFIRVDRNKYKNTWGVTDFTNKTIEIYVDPNAKKLDVELAQIEHTIYHETQHIIANWTNMYQGGDVTTITKAMMLEPKQEKIKTLYETLNDDTFNGEESQYTELAVQIYALLGGEWLAESERLKYNPVNVKRVYDKSTVFGQTDYLDISYTPQGNGLKMSIKGYGFYKNIKLDLFTTEQTSLTNQRNTPITNIQGNITDEFRAIQHKQSYKNKTKDMLNETPTSDVYVTGVGDAKASNEAIHALYPENKYATTIEYADQVLNEGLMYGVVYDDLTKGQQIDRNQSHTFEEIKQFVNSELNNKYSTERTALDEKYKNVEKDSKEYSDYLKALKALDKKFSKTFNDYEDVVKEAIDKGFLKRTDILRDDFDYSINAIRKLRNDGKIPMERGKTVGLNTVSFSQLDFSSNVKGEEGRSFEETVADETDDFAKLEEESGLTSEGASQIITALKSKLDKPSGFELIDNIYKEANDGNKAGLQMKQLLNKQGLMTKEDFEKTATEKINQIKNNYGERLTEQENKRVNYDVSKIDNPEKFRRYLKALDQILEIHKNDVQKIVEKPTVELSLPEQNMKEEEKEDEYDFGTIQKESRREVADNGWGSKSKEINENVRTRLSRVLGEKINSDRSSYGDNSRLLKLTGKENTFEVYENINPNTFRDCFEITRAYLPYGELVDLHDVEDSEKHGIGYKKCECYLSKDGLSGFAITPDGDLISVFNGNEKRGFLRAIALIIREKVKTLDCFISYKQNLQDMYSKLFGFKTASVMDYNMEYDHDQIAETHNKPKVAFMVNTNADVQTKNFIETDYDDAKAYQMSFANKEQKTVKETKLTSNVFSDKTGFLKFDAYTAQELAEQGKTKEYVKMSPKDYIDRAFKLLYEKENIKENYNTWVNKQKRLRYDLKEFGETSNVDYFKNKMLSGELIEMPYLDYVTKGQEGIHRAMAAQDLGISEIDVAIMKESKKPRKKKTPVETIETATKSQPSTLGDAIVALMESDEIKTRMSEVQNVGESNQELKSVSKDIWRNHADIFAGINDSNYETVRNSIEKSGNRTALIEFDYYCREFKGRFNKETTKLIDDNAQKVLHESGQILSTQSHTLYNSKPINDIVNSLGEDGYTVDVDDSVIAEYDERLANKDKHISDLEQQIKDLEQQLQNKDLNALEKADISDTLQKVAEEKYVFENGSNIDLMDWLLNNVSAPTIAEVFAKQTEIQKSFLDKLVYFAERAQIEGKDVGFYLKSKETGDIKAFPKTREFLTKWLKKIRTYRMWAMLSSPTTWVRNWVGNTGMKSLDTVTNAFERMLSRRFFSEIDYEQSLNTIQTNNNKISQMFEKLSTLKEGSTAYNNLDNQIKKLQKETHKLEFDVGQLKYQETRAGKEVYKHISEKYGDYILNQLIRKQSSKYDETGGKGGEIKRMERAIEYKSANTLQKLCIKAQDITQWGLSTGIFGDEPMIMNAIIKNFGNLVASNTDYLLYGIQTEFDVLSKKSQKTDVDNKRLAILEKALNTKDVNAIFDAMDEAETKRFFENATHRAEEQYFKNGNKLSRMLSDLGKKSPIVGEIMSWLMPFPKVAANILTMAYKYSPLGFVSMLIQWSKYKQKSSIDYKGQITGFEKADIIRSASQATTGTFMLIAGALAAALGWIDIDDDDYLGPALKVGNFMRISLKDLAPSMTTFSTAAALMYSWKNHKSGVEEALNNLYDNTLLGNVDNIFRYGGLTKFAENIPISLTGQYVPAVLKLINNTVFKTPQKDKSGNLLEKTWKTLAASIPGLSATVPNKINPYTGEPMYASGSENWFLNFLAKASPITVKYTYGKSALEQEAARLNTTTTGLSGTFTFNGKNVTVNNKEQLAKFRANYIESEFDKIQSDKTLVTVKDTKTGKMITTKYSKLTDDQKQNVLTSLFSKASNAAKVEYWTQSGNKYIATSTEEYQRLKKTVTTPSKIIFNKNWSKSKFVEA